MSGHARIGQQDFRRYLAGAGVAEALVGFLRSLRNEAVCAEDGLVELKKYFGEIVSPKCEMISRMQEENTRLRERFDLLVQKKAELIEAVAETTREVIAKKMITKLSYKLADVPKEAVLKCMLGPTLNPKKYNAELVAAIPKIVNRDKLRSLLLGADNLCRIASVWFVTTSDKPAWENVSPSEEFRSFWKSYESYELKPEAISP